MKQYPKRLGELLEKEKKKERNDVSFRMCLVEWKHEMMKEG